MVDREVLTRRLLVLNECLNELARPEAGDATRLGTDRVLRAAVERWLQVAIESCIDIATHVIASEGWTPPATAREAFLVVAGHGRLPLDLAESLGAAAGLRNVLVHAYVVVDTAKLASVVRNDLDDLRELARHATTW